MAIRVMIVDDHMIVRSGLGAVLSAYEEFDLVGEAGSGEEAVTVCEKVGPDVILMDLVMPGMGGPAAIETILQRYPSIRILALTSFKEKELVESALKAGAISYLLKNISAEALVKAITDAVAGHSILAPEAAEALIEGMKKPETAVFDLTSRETEILRLMIRGLSNKEIASELVLSLSTIKFHISNILSKLNAGSRTEAVALAVKYNLAT